MYTEKKNDMSKEVKKIMMSVQIYTNNYSSIMINDYKFVVVVLVV